MYLKFVREVYGKEDRAHTLYVEAEANTVDNGIGSYEFWGHKGINHDCGFEIKNMNVYLQRKSKNNGVKRRLLKNISLPLQEEINDAIFFKYQRNIEYMIELSWE